MRGLFDRLNSDIDQLERINWNGGDFLEVVTKHGFKEVYVVKEGVVFIPGNPISVEELLHDPSSFGLEGRGIFRR